jgi:hypothetical protein
VSMGRGISHKICEAAARHLIDIRQGEYPNSTHKLLGLRLMAQEANELPALRTMLFSFEARPTPVIKLSQSAEFCVPPDQCRILRCKWSQLSKPQ